MASSIIIDERFCGPPGMGNGGYVCGWLANFIRAPAVEVTLRRPIPLGRQLPVEEATGATVSLLGDKDDVIADAKALLNFDLEPPFTLSYEEAVRAMPRYIGFARHGFPRCFVCGPARGVGDGLRIFPGRIDGKDHTVAAPWTPDAGLADDGGRVRPEFIWAALDCPGAFALMGDRSRPMLLGRMAAKVSPSILAGERCVVLAWRLSVEGKKQIAGSAIFNQQGEVAGAGRAIWFDAANLSA